MRMTWGTHTYRKKKHTAYVYQACYLQWHIHCWMLDGAECVFFFEGVDTQTPFFCVLLLSSSILPLCGREGSDWIGTNQIEYYIDLRNMNVHSCLPEMATFYYFPFEIEFFFFSFSLFPCAMVLSPISEILKSGRRQTATADRTKKIPPLELLLLLFLLWIIMIEHIVWSWELGRGWEDIPFQWQPKKKKSVVVSNNTTVAAQFFCSFFFVCLFHSAIECV